MATKSKTKKGNKPKPRTVPKKTVKQSAKTTAKKPSKQVSLKSKFSAGSASKSSPKAEKPRGARKVESSSQKVVAKAPIPRIPSKQFAGAVAALEAGIKLMYAEDYEKAIKSFNKVIADYPEEPEIQASAKARIQACEKKIHERSRTVFRSSDDHYNIGIALLNRGELDSALNHLQSALKLSPKADHVLYAMAAANALQGNKDQALSYLKQSIHHRPENRFQAVQDHDFDALVEEAAFKDLITPAEK